MKFLNWFLKHYKKFTAVFLALMLLKAVLTLVYNNDVDLEEVFADYEACFVIYDLEKDEYQYFNRWQCKQKISPCSTFKITNALIGLEVGVIEDAQTSKPWDGKPKYLPIWEQDHTLQSAIQNSVVWWFQDNARQVGTERMENYLKQLRYGDRDIDSGIDNFWLYPNSLRISAKNQIQLLAKLYRDELPLSKHAMHTVKEILVMDKQPNYVLSGKTGSGFEKGEGVLGWFVGYLSSAKGRYVFATNIRAEKEAHGQKAKQLTYESLNSLELL